MSEQLDYKDVEQYLRTFTDEAAPHDFSGLFHLVLAGIETLRENGADQEILENAHLITDAQAGFLRRLLGKRAESMEWFKDYIGHSSHTGLL